MPTAFIVALCASAALAAGCASEIRRVPVEVTTAAPETGRRFVSAAQAEARPESGYSRTIRADTEFIVVGRIAQGLVMKPTQTVLTLEGAHMHEAYAVFRDGMWVGFYLPVERAYSALPLPVPISLQERK